MRNNVIKIRIFLWHIALLSVFFFVYMAVVPGGEITYSQDFSGQNYFVSDFSPKERVDASGAGIEIIGEPAYISLKTPRNFNEVEFSLSYKNNNPEHNPIIEAGLLVDGDIWRHETKPIENVLLERLYKDWDYIQEGGDVLFLRNRASSTYSSIGDFLEEPPLPEEIAVYNYDYNFEYRPEKHATGTKEFDLGYDLRGDYQILTYIEDEELFFDFDFVDLNSNGDEDSIDLHLYYKDRLIDSRHLEDDGTRDESGEPSGQRSLNFSLKNLPSGVYKIELRAGDDIISKAIRTKQRKVVFVEKLWIDSFEQDKNFFTNSKQLHFRTTNPASLQDISLAGGKLSLSETFRQFSTSSDASSTDIFFSEGDIMIAGNGLFSPDRDYFFNPRVKKIDPPFSLSDSKIKYIIAGYEAKKPSSEDGLFEKTLKFDLGRAYREDSRYGFILSVPGLRADDERDDSVYVHNIEFKLSGTDLFSKVKSIFR